MQNAGCPSVCETACLKVIFFEQDWNPQADKQAMQRAHRMGQTRPVLVLHFATEHTVDEVSIAPNNTPSFQRN